MAAKKKKQRMIGKDNPDFDILEALASLPKPPPKNKGGRPVEYIEGIDPHFMVAFRHLLNNLTVDIYFFWEVVIKAKTPKGRKALRSQFAREEKLIDETEESYRKIKELAIQSAELDYKNNQALSDSDRREVDMFKALIDDFEHKLPKVKSIVGLKLLAKDFAREKKKNSNWKEDIQRIMPKKYQNLKFYDALSDYLKDLCGVEFSPPRIREEIRQAAKTA